MTIRQKIKLSNIMMALIPIALTAIIVVVCLQTSLGSYWYTLETMYKDENGIQSAQSLIYTYQQELWESNWGQRPHTGAVNGIKKNEKMNHLEDKLSRMGYHFLIRKDGNLDTEIAYMEPDEFGEVCRNFDEMRAYLKTSVEQRLKDEQQRKDLIIGISGDMIPEKALQIASVRYALIGLTEN